MIKRSLINFCIASLCAAPSLALANTQVGVRFVVDDSLISGWRTEQTIRDELDTWILEANTILADSKINMSLYTAETVMRQMATDSSGNTESHDETIFNHMNRQIGGFYNVENRAKEIGADYTVAIVPRVNNGETGDDLRSYCGVAKQVSTNSDEVAAKRFIQSTAIVAYHCGSDTFVHELGHLFGLAHGTQVAQALDDKAHNKGYHNYSKGWGRIVEIVSPGYTEADEALETGEYGTIMVGNYLRYWSQRNANTFIGMFSNPNVSDVVCSTNSRPSPCGNAYLGDAARTIRELSSFYASHQTPDVHTLTYSDYNLRACISQTYPYTPGSDAYDIHRIRNISCPASGVRTLDGLENITGLKMPTIGNYRPTIIYPHIDLSRNQIINLDALYDVIPGASINLQGNNVANCHQLDDLEQIHSGLIRPDKCLNVAALTVTTSIL
ncbi:zinc-dependent metalloprotease family protein [Pseudoalteromonas byunsanensis]|uniref:Peptidase M43 pregnancy-associated plasma-A domain-containing protein n=1 Tax=Pseudoalteromonas byunsanensis TaxID=327939 RepID=A0A1S1N2R7_9GAMM|nr:zinc-dependent metalloprotease family protein [Pseudoalteromonas byunsanensis]OHU93747.1 hypothetical protein BIW53_18595 [Pseudoalteromonas byunsanensis]